MFPFTLNVLPESFDDNIAEPSMVLVNISYLNTAKVFPYHDIKMFPKTTTLPCYELLVKVKNEQVLVRFRHIYLYCQLGYKVFVHL